MQYTGNTLENQWMPFTPNKHFKANPRLFTRAEGAYYTNHHGDQVLDAVSGLFCTNAGHGRREITEAVTRQIQEMDFAPPFQLPLRQQGLAVCLRLVLRPADLHGK